MKVPVERAESEIIIKKSRFIAIAEKIDSLEQVKDIVRKVREEHPKANHVVHAAVAGKSGTIYSSSDDKEPKNTAGRPALEVLKGSKVTNIVVCIVRYFGGTLLGTGGLVRAYSKAAQEGLVKSRVITKNHGVLIEIGTDYNGVGKLQYLFGQSNVPIMDSQYTESVKMQILVPAGEKEQIKKSVTEATSGRASITDIKELYYAVSQGEYLLFEN